MFASLQTLPRLCVMIFQFSRETRSWDLVADSGELLGTAVSIPGECWEGRMDALLGGRRAWATDLDLIQQWMMQEASTPR